MNENQSKIKQFCHKHNIVGISNKMNRQKYSAKSNLSYVPKGCC